MNGKRFLPGNEEQPDRQFPVLEVFHLLNLFHSDCLTPPRGLDVKLSRFIFWINGLYFYCSSDLKNPDHMGLD